MYLTYYKYKQEIPVLDIKITDLPPYDENNQKSTVTIKNVGKKMTSKGLETTVDCSWMNGVSYKLNLPVKSYFLAPNEEMIWKVKIDQDIPSNGIISVKVVDRKNNMNWEYHEQIT